LNYKGKTFQVSAYSQQMEMMQLQKLHHSIQTMPQPWIAQWLLCVCFYTLQISALGPRLYLWVQCDAE